MEDLFQEIAVEATTLQHSEMRTEYFWSSVLKL
jgi:hypothetical protein